MNNKTVYAIFGGYSDQYWTSVATPVFKGRCHGLTVCKFDTATGTLCQHSRIWDIESPATLTVSPDGSRVYAANETSDFTQRGYGGGISAFSFDYETGELRLINQSLSYGAYPADISLDKSGKFLFVANHGSKLYCTRFEEKEGELVPVVIRDEGCLCMFSINEDGSIGRLLDRVVFTGSGLNPVDHGSAHPHAVKIDEQDFIIVPDKGADSIHILKLDRKNKKMVHLSDFHTGLGSSPRQATFVKDSDFVLVVNEYDGHLCSYKLERQSGELTQISRLDCGDPSEPYFHKFYGTPMHAWANDVQIHPNGKYAYTNIDQNIFSQFEINRCSGELRLVSRLKTRGPSCRGMKIDRTGSYLIGAGWDAEKACIFKIDPVSGALSLTQEIGLPTPTAVEFIYPPQI